MPHFTLPVRLGVGPTLAVYIGVSSSRSEALRADGIEPPSPVPLLFLIDTGASRSCVDEAAIAPLGLSPTGTISVRTSTTGIVPVEQLFYDVSLYIHHAESSKFMALLPMTAADFSASPIHGLLGRDFLKSCLLVYDGLAQTYSIAF